MANSVVKVTDVTDDPESDSLLLLVGEDGNVIPDRQTVDNFLKSTSRPTNIQIMHIDKCDQKSIDVTVDNVIYMPDNMDVVNEDITTKIGNMQDIDTVALNLHNVKLDHDYTCLTLPNQASSAQGDDEDEDDELTNTLNIMHGRERLQRNAPKSIMVNVPSKPSKGIKILSSITIPAPSSPATTQKVLDKREPTILNKPTPVVIKGKAKVLHTSPKLQQEKQETELNEKCPTKGQSNEEEHDTEGEGSEDEDSVTEDDENDSDFDIREEISGVKGKKAAKSARDIEKAKTPHEPSVATPDTQISKVKVSDAKPDCKPELKSEKSNETPQQSTETPSDKSQTDRKTDQEPEVKPEDVKPPEKKHPKKKKEPPKPIPGDFALFSTPDIIRKVGGKDPITPTNPETPTTPKGIKGFDHSKPQVPMKTDPLSSPKFGKITPESRSKSISEMSSTPPKQNRLSLDEKDRMDKDKHVQHRTSSTEGKGKDRRDSVDKHKTLKNTEEKRKLEHLSRERLSSDSSSERGASVSERDRKLSESDKPVLRYSKNAGEGQEISAQDVRAIIMNEDTKTYTTNTIPIPESPVQVLNNPEASNLNLDASGLDLDQSILDNINNDMISEDILYQVAKQLVSNTELQNAIDKGINEGVLDTSGIQEAMDISSQMSQSSNSSSFSGSQQSDVIKEGTQIVRPDGRILVLPPIERPTTRSRNKRKDEVAKPPFKQPPTKSDNRTKERPLHKPLDDEHVSGNELDSSEEEESEDDPNKLWCICNQPHNNRFMICCDTCEEWYHGKCVNITKAMGQQMESEGKEWICLFCKDSALRRPMAAARRIKKASRSSRESSSSSKKYEKEKSAILMPCVVCQRPSRKNSIYCSENCILSHAQGIERVVVFERSTGNMLTGAKAPSATNLDQWLKHHPGYEVVRSGGKVVTTKVKPGILSQSKLKLVKNANNEGVSLAVQQKGVNIGVMAHSPKRSSQTNQEQGTPKVTKLMKVTPKTSVVKDSKIKLINPQPMPTVLKPKEPQTPIKKIQIQTTLSPISPTSSIVKIAKKETPKKETPKESKTPKPPKLRTKDDVQTPQSKADDIRDNVQKTIFEQLLVRLKGSDIKLTDETVKNISIEIETELYKCFGDTGQKYKNKYRSLIFNIKDPKNQTLWRRICEKSISSYELVRLSPDDMASQELAKWREQEAKHQLDMIKKSEIELLNCNRQYVLKTHKGEEVLEDNTIGNKADNTEIIKSLTEGSTLDTNADVKKNNSKDRDKSRDKRSTSKHGHKEKNRDKKRHVSRDKREKDNKRRSSSHDRSRSRKRSRSRSKDSKTEKKREKRSRSRSRDERERSKDRDKYRKLSAKASRHKKTGNTSATDSLDKRAIEILEQLNKIAPPVEDRLWKHVPQDDIVPGNAPMDSDSDHEVPTSTVTIPTPPRTQEVEEISSQLSMEGKAVSKLKEADPEEDKGRSPTAKEPRGAMQIWSGTINMVDVAKISITAHEVSGDCSGLSKELSPSLDIVGRISPDTVWEYIGKMRSSNSKVISLIRLNATNIEEQMPYLALYSYLSSRNRLGVVKSTNKSIKDFYILPLAAQKPIPQALLPISGPVKQWLEASVKKINDRVQNGFEEARPALLLGIIVRDKRKRSYLDIMPTTATPHKKTRVEVHVVQTQPARSYTPPPMSAEVTPTPLPVPSVPKLDPRLAKHAPPPLPSTSTTVPEIVPPPLPALNSPSLMSKLSPLIMSIVNPVKSSTPPPKSLPIEDENPNDDDEPYSPEDFDPEASIIDTTSASLNMSTISELSITQTSTSTEQYIPGLGGDSDLSAKKLDIQRQMEELNKQIEQQKSEITSITKNIATAESEIVGSALASIALPSNLQQILDSIKTIGTTSSGESSTTSIKQTSAPTKEPDLTIPLIIPKTFSRPLTSGQPSDLSSNTIPLNLPVKSKLTPPQINSPLQEEKPTSVLSTLSEEDLIKKAAEMLNEEESSVGKKKISPPPPKLNFQPPKKSKIEVSLPPVPGVDD
ncbi:hypothetical protein HUJ04_002834 [Dendroctonus ponderosae]|uniref:Death-inducer obliterator 1 n=1 Tax=Dendroctonus ponderosae TaxID=77166 RepID=A0AAR5P820_DENPD|nr:hypothetical protein HUJ04_002834 [Dendroctonus ponderosae]